MANLDRIQDFKPEYSDNLFRYTADFENEPTVNVTGGTMNTSYESDIVFDEGKSLYLFPTSYNSTNISFNFGSALQTTIQNSGRYILSLRICNTNTTNEFFVPFVMFVKVFEDGINTQTFELSSSSDEVNDSKKWITYAQSLQLTGSNIDFSFEIDHDSTYPFPNINFYLDALKLELDDRFLGVPSIYSKPKAKQITGYKSRVDTINTQNLTALTENLISFSGTLEENGGLTLMDANAKITPISLNDIISVDFSFTSINPSGTDQYINCNFVVDGVVYRSQTFPLVKGAGFEDNCSVSFVFPVTATFLTNGGAFYLYPSSATTIKNRYLAVTRIGKGV